MKILPSLLPRIISSAGGFTEEQRNELLDEARAAAERLAKEYVQNLTSDVQKSARQTMEQMAHSLGIEEVTVDFLDDGFEPVRKEKQEQKTEQ